MGLRGPIAKADERRQRRNLRAPLVVSGTVDMPAPPSGLLKQTKERWATYWASDLAKAARESHLPMIERLFIRYDERDRAYRTVRKDGRVVEGSTHQLVAHPLLKYIDACDKEIRALEDRLGLSPKGMVSLGAAMIGAQKSLDDVNRSLEADDVDEEADPRISVA